MSGKRKPVLRLRAFARSMEGDTEGFDAMEALSWDLGYEPITDMPDVCDPMLTHLVHHVNDTCCEHMERIGSADWLCMRCSSSVLDLAYHTVGTVLSGLPQIDRARIHTRLAFEQAACTATVLGPTTYTDHGLEACGRWIADPQAVTINELSEVVDTYPANAVAVDRIMRNVAAAAAASGDARECARLAGKAASAAIDARQPNPRVADFVRTVDHFMVLSSEVEQATNEQPVVRLR